jgi:hypothetical protein
MRYYSPAELNATEIEVFRQEKLELRTGDSIRMSKTRRDMGHAAHEQYRVSALRDNGDIVLSGAAGRRSSIRERFRLTGTSIMRGPSPGTARRLPAAVSSSRWRVRWGVVV